MTARRYQLRVASLPPSTPIDWQVSNFATSRDAIAAGREQVARLRTVLAVVIDTQWQLGDPLYVWRGTPDPYTPPDLTGTERVLLYPDAVACRGDAQRGDVVWGTDPKSRQWTSGGLRGTFTGKDHAYHVAERRDGRGIVLYGAPLCGTPVRSSRLDPASGPYARCRRCEAFLTARGVGHEPPESTPT